MAAMTGGDKLEKYLRELAAKVQNPGTLNVGFLEGSEYPDGTPVAAVAAYNEYGGSGPPRPFFRGMIAKKRGNWGKKLGEILKQNHFDGKKSLALMGEGISGQLRESIQEFSDPANAPSTVAQKGFDKPLVDTGHMLNSVDSEVKE